MPNAALEILKLMDEPTAAALSSITIKEGTVVVFDMGAGSYTVSVLGVSGTDIEVPLSVNLIYAARS